MKNEDLKKRLVWVLFMFFIISVLYACEKDNTEAELLAFDLINQTCAVEIDNTDASVTITLPDEVTSAEKLVADFAISKGATASIGGEIQTSGLSEIDFESPFSLNVLAEDGLNQTNYKVSTFNNSYTDGWGLGGFQKSTLSNNRDYDWYLDQSNTGTYSGINCGPTSTTMAAKWAKENFTKTPQDARNAYRSEGGWWYTDDIDAYLTDNNIQHYFISLANNAAETSDKMIEQLAKGNILILCLDMFYITDGTNTTWHVDKFYSTNAEDWGHFIVVKGYKLVDKKLFFEIYDPYCYNKKYSDGSYKGRDRFYRNADLYRATSVWWNYAIVVNGDVEKSMPVNALDRTDVPNQRGR